MELKKPYPFEYNIGPIRSPYQVGESLYCTLHSFSFKSVPAPTFSKIKPKRYVVEIEEYPHMVHAVKFYRACDKSKGSINKFRVLTNSGCPWRILSTVLIISLRFLEKNPYASFAFYGVEDIGESQNETRRFRLYRQLLKNYIGYDTFDPYEYKGKSYMLLLNKRNPDPQLIQKIEKMFKEGFDIR